MASSITVVQITNHDVKILGGQWPALSYSFYRERSHDQDLKADLSLALTKIPGGLRQVVFIIPRHDAVLRELELPAVDPAETSRMVELQLPSIVPVDPAQALFRFRSLKSDRGGYTTVLAGVVLNNVIQKFADALSVDACAIKDIFLSVDTCAEFIRVCCDNSISGDESDAFMFTGERSAELVIFRRGEAVFSYYLPYGRQDVFESNGFAGELNRCLQDFTRRHPGLRVERIISGLNESEVSALNGKFPTGSGCAVIASDLFGGLPDQTRAFVSKEGLDSSWVSLLGLFAADNKKLMSFLPTGIHFTKIRHQNTKRLIGFAVSLIMLLLAAGGLIFSMFYKYENYLGSLQRQVRLLEPRLEHIEQETAFLSMIASKSPESSIIEMIKEIFLVVPDDVSLQYLAMRNSGQFELQGTALEDQSLSRLQAVLVSSDFFSRVNLQYATRRKRFNKEYTEFKITFERAE